MHFSPLTSNGTAFFSCYNKEGWTFSQSIQGNMTHPALQGLHSGPGVALAKDRQAPPESLTELEVPFNRAEEGKSVWGTFKIPSPFEGYREFSNETFQTFRHLLL